METATSSEQPLPETADHVLVSFNPKAGSGRRRRNVQQLVDLLQDRGLKTETLTSLDSVSDRATELLADGRLRAVVGAGGDGTIHALLNCLPEHAPLAMLPLGTESLLAKFHRQPRGARPLTKMLLDGHTRSFDAGRANGKLFLLMASAGFDAEVARRMHESRTGNITHLSYAWPILAAIRQYEYPPMKIEFATNEETQTLEARFCFIFNLPQYGIGLKFTPEADGTDGLLNFCAFRGGSFWHGLKYLTAVSLGRHQRLKDCNTEVATRIRITSEVQVPYQVDGDPGGRLPLELDVLPRRVKLIVPD